MLLRCENGKVQFIDATSDDGVSVCCWDWFVNKGFHKHYDRIVYRPIHFRRNYYNQTQLEQFLKKLIGKRYKLNPLRLLKKKSDYDSVNSISDDKGYFCSELIASILKFLGFLPANISSSQYWPGSFSSESNTKLINGATFGDEQLIILDLLILLARE